MGSRAGVASSRLKAQVRSGLLRLCVGFLLGGCGGALQPQAPDPEYGKSVAKEYEVTDLIDGVPYFGHDGGVWGVNAVLRMTPDNDVVIVLSNVSPGAGQRAAMRAADQLARLPKNAERKPSLAAPTEPGVR